MDEHERIVKAAQEVDKMIGFYVHFVVFLLVCGGLAAVNWFATPEVWWAAMAISRLGRCRRISRSMCVPVDQTLSRVAPSKDKELSSPMAQSEHSRAASTSAAIRHPPARHLDRLSRWWGVRVPLDARRSRDRREADKSRATALKDRQGNSDAQLKQGPMKNCRSRCTVSETKDQLGQAEASSRLPTQSSRDGRTISSRAGKPQQREMQPNGHWPKRRRDAGRSHTSRGVLARD